jgi:hypothetical protein
MAAASASLSATRRTVAAGPALARLAALDSPVDGTAIAFRPLLGALNRRSSIPEKPHLAVVILGSY